MASYVVANLYLMLWKPVTTSSLEAGTKGEQAQRPHRDRPDHGEIVRLARET